MILLKDWANAVLRVGHWYEKNIPGYNTTYGSGTLNNEIPEAGLCQWSDVGFVSACLRTVGVFSINQIYNISQWQEFAENGANIHLEQNGFDLYEYCDEAILKKWDILYVYSEYKGIMQKHIEIYAGNNKSFTWGKRTKYDNISIIDNRMPYIDCFWRLNN